MVVNRIQSARLRLFQLVRRTGINGRGKCQSHVRGQLHSLSMVDQAFEIAEMDLPGLVVYFRLFRAGFEARQGETAVAREIFADIVATFPPRLDAYAHFVARAELALLDGADGTALLDEWRSSDEERERFDIVEAGWLLWQLTGDDTVLDTARETLDELAESLPPGQRAGIYTSLVAHRGVTEATGGVPENPEAA